MWDPQWEALRPTREMVRLDLRGFGESVTRPEGPLSPTTDVIATLDELRLNDCDLVGASLGAGVAVEVALTRPDLVASLLLAAPGGSLIPEMTPDLEAFITAERAAMADDDLDAAVEANLQWWVDGPVRGRGDALSSARQRVAAMQRRAFELTADWDELEEDEMDPPPFERLTEVTAPTLVLHGGLDLEAIARATALVVDGIDGAVRTDWDDVAHLPSMEQPDRFVALLTGWLDRDQPDGVSPLQRG